MQNVYRRYMQIVLYIFLYFFSLKKIILLHANTMEFNVTYFGHDSSRTTKDLTVHRTFSADRLFHLLTRLLFLCDCTLPAAQSTVNVRSYAE